MLDPTTKNSPTTAIVARVMAATQQQKDAWYSLERLCDKKIYDNRAFEDTTGHLRILVRDWLEMVSDGWLDLGNSAVRSYSDDIAWMIRRVDRYVNNHKEMIALSDLKQWKATSTAFYISAELD
jgi:hypothetical protein